MKWDGTRKRWHERLVRYDAQFACWVPWHWVVTENGLSARRWFGFAR